jgi:hypothetical protein
MDGLTDAIRLIRPLDFPVNLPPNNLFRETIGTFTHKDNGDKIRRFLRGKYPELQDRWFYWRILTSSLTTPSKNKCKYRENDDTECLRVMKIAGGHRFKLDTV